MTWQELCASKVREDITAAQEVFPFIVQQFSYQSLELEIRDWVLQNVGDAMIVISKELQGPAQNFPPVLVTYGFKYENDAVAFRLKFPSNVSR